MGTELNEVHFSVDMKTPDIFFSINMIKMLVFQYWNYPSSYGYDTEGKGVCHQSWWPLKVYSDSLNLRWLS